MVGGFLARFASLGEYYEQHPPKPLIYYVLYPLLAPYWLIKREARREFLLYRRINAIALVAMLGFGAYDYVTNWRPEIPLSAFVTSSIATLVMQLLATVCLVMPIVTTVVRYHRSGHRRALAVMLALCAGLSVILLVAVRRHERPTPSVTQRVRWRATATPERAVA
ncbi:MAG: hypothetical protein M3680_17770, partial [Myxococcota bacterium]|nr:hypothetical protein [Myxococcota bacterium]